MTFEPAERTRRRYANEPDGSERHAYRDAYRTKLAEMVAAGQSELAARRMLERNPELIEVPRPRPRRCLC